MKTRTLCKIWVLTCCSLCFIACGDDNEPLSLINTEGNETLIDITSNTLQLSPFSEGESFYINGGDGAYTIDNSNEEAVKFSYDGRTLTLLPVAQGKAIITIQDRDNNTYQLQVEVTYPQETYRVSGVKASAIGDDLTQMETQLLEAQIAADIYAGIEGKYVFTYMVPDSTEGEVEMIPERNILPIKEPKKGVFQSSSKYQDNGLPYIEMKVHLTSGEDIVYSCYNTDIDSTYLFVQDVTDAYRTEYPKVEQALSFQYLQRTKTE